VPPRRETLFSALRSKSEEGWWLRFEAVLFQAQPALRAYPGARIETRGAVMSTDTKTPFDHVNDVIAQLKEMRHYAKNNVEALTAQWLLFDGELKKLKQAEPTEALMTSQGQLHDALEAQIAALEELATTLKPPPEEV
jgi:hypothetical protein